MSEINQSIGLPALDCGHEEWQIGCETCYGEMVGVITGNTREAERVALEATVQGATLFAWFVVQLIADLDMQIQQLAQTTIDLRKRENLLVTLQNVRNLSVTIVKTCTNPVKLDAALRLAAEFASSVDQAMKNNPQQTSESAAPVPAATKSGIILTDTL